MKSLQQKLELLNQRSLQANSKDSSSTNIPIQSLREHPYSTHHHLQEEHLNTSEMPCDRDFFCKEAWMNLETWENFQQKFPVLHTLEGAHHFRHPLPDLWKSYPLYQEKLRLLEIQESSLPASSKVSIQSLPHDCCFLDIESAGQRGGLVFLVGVLWKSETGWVLDQFFSSDYCFEESMFKLLLQYWPENKSVVTFNGKGFDIPCIQGRLKYFGLPKLSYHQHIDLLPLSRKRFQGKTPNCKLQTLEKYVLGRARVGDIPGSEIPKAYDRFVQDKDIYGKVMIEIHYHNLVDIVSLLELLVYYQDHESELS